MEEYKKYWRHFSNFNGRSTVKDYWTVFLINFLIGCVISATGLMELSYLATIVFFIPGLAIAVRRMHDVNKSGWYLLMSLIPLIGWIFVIVALCSASVVENNKYGPLAE